MLFNLLIGNPRQEEREKPNLRFGNQVQVIQIKGAKSKSGLQEAGPEQGQ